MEKFNPNKITYFKEEKIRKIQIPEKFTFPFYYEPDQLTKLAAEDLQHYLENKFTSNHNFGLDESQEGLVIGKMFGVLVVQDNQGKLGYLSAFSGKLAGTNSHEKFVPPVFDMLAENSFFLKEEEVLNEMNRKIAFIENDLTFQSLFEISETQEIQSKNEISAYRQKMKINKAERKATREFQKEILTEADYKELEIDLIKQSYRDQFELKKLQNNWKEKIETTKIKLEEFTAQINQLKIDRKEKSSQLQNQLFEQYSFLNQDKTTKSLAAIFKETVFEKPPAAAGECATPKLLQYAFLNDLKPISFAEFWWGESPKSEIRQHKQFYPACSGKCRPILKHMLSGMPVDENPLLKNLGENKQLKIVYEDEYLVIVNKPEELLSVPGIEIQDSVYSRLQDMLEGIEPLMIHRLDMSTSGLLVVAKTKEIHKNIQRQFIQHKVKKRYTALLSKKIEQENGKIELPMRLNVLDRPRQMVCFENGKVAITEWKAIEKTTNTTKVHFWPITGRTHQLRVHAAHQLGLGAPIVGDDLYGNPSNRLHLHAGYLEFTHPQTKEILKFEVEANF